MKKLVLLCLLLATLSSLTGCMLMHESHGDDSYDPDVSQGSHSSGHHH